MKVPKKNLFNRKLAQRTGKKKIFKNRRMTETRRTNLFDLITRINTLTKTIETKGGVEMIADGTEFGHNALTLYTLYFCIRIKVLLKCCRIIVVTA